MLTDKELAEIRERAEKANATFSTARVLGARRQLREKDVPALLDTIAEVKKAAQDVVDANKYRYRIAYPKTEQEAEDYCNQLIHAGRVEQEAIDRLAALLEGGN